MIPVQVLLEDHELVAVDGRGQWCSCGVVDAAFVEHVADVLTAALGVKRYWPKELGEGCARA